MEHYQIFISYRRDGGEFFGKILSDKLLAKGYSVFFDVESLHSGPFNTQLYQVIDQCQDFILILSPHALDRCVNPGDWVCSEIAYAIEKHKNIVPVVMRDFVWPETLPESIKTLPLYENEELARVTSHEHLDASVQRICRGLLKSRPSGDKHYKMENQEYYKIKTPWGNPYKKANVNRNGLLHIEAFISTAFQNACDICPEEEDPGQFASLKELFQWSPESLRWYEDNSRQLEQIRQRARELKDYKGATGKASPYYYANAVQYALGHLTALPMEWMEQHRSQCFGTVSYCLDWPYEAFFKLLSIYGEKEYQEFREFLPGAFEVWPHMKQGTPGERAQAEQYTILLFDFMLELALLLNNTYTDGQHTALVRTQILCYYKWLKKNGFYLPREMQEKIYRYFQ